jgi:hypothetical protein
MKRLNYILGLLLITALYSCEKNAVQDITGDPPQARIKFFNFGLGAPGVNFYANDTKMTAISSTTAVESVTGVVYGGVGAGGLYSSIKPGSYVFSGRISALVDKDLPIANITATIAADKDYSFYLSGVYNTTSKTVDGFVIEDAFPAKLDTGVAYVRFVNAIHNSSPMILYAKNTNTTAAEIAVGAAVAYKAGGAFITVPNGVYNLSVRNSGSATNLFTRTSVSFSRGRVYTIGARGDITIVSTTAVNRPFLDNTLNR